ncbi:YfiR family protein [Pseudomaricurvus sp. HS19]|uniref:YfiR family protein n=1 Tax=Pseudomaricurvus sp. HS19 TaxID=2692626 RepID=UPI00137107FD|nr:YfiR family protein [Pseudomaricurvus sp. HS19]MYM63205.1 DUF4154 domain-containing protein [Pseudomaricurvus sp. HS19]
MQTLVGNLPAGRCRQMFWMLLLVMAALPVRAADVQPQMVKAAFVFNIAKFMSWPEGTDEQAPFTFCFYRRDSLGEAFELLQSRGIAGRELQARVVEKWRTSSGCDLLLVPEEELLAFKLEARGLPTRPTLVVADLTDEESRGMAHTGVHVALVRQGARIAFEVHLDELQRSGLKASSELLKLARIVRDNG